MAPSPDGAGRRDPNIDLFRFKGAKSQLEADQVEIDGLFRRRGYD
jgi:hypothetical protein